MGLVTLAGCNAPEGAASYRIQAGRAVPATQPAGKGDFFASQAASQAREDAGQVQAAEPAVPSLPPPSPIRPAPRSAPGSRW